MTFPVWLWTLVFGVIAIAIGFGLVDRAPRWLLERLCAAASALLAPAITLALAALVLAPLCLAVRFDQPAPLLLWIPMALALLLVAARC